MLLQAKTMPSRIDIRTAAQDEKELERFRPQPAECSRCQGRVNHAIEKMLEGNHPASSVPNRFLGVGGAVS